MVESAAGVYFYRIQRRDFITILPVVGFPAVWRDEIILDVQSLKKQSHLPGFLGVKS